MKVDGAGELVSSAAGSLTRPMAVFRDFSVACCTIAECSGSFSQSVSSLLPFVALFVAGGGASETKTRRAFLVLVSERLHSCSSLSTCRELRYEAPVACFDHRSCPYHSAAPLMKSPEYVLKHDAPRTSHCGCTISILEDVENVRVGWPGGALSLRILASDRSLGIGHWAL